MGSLVLSLLLSQTLNPGAATSFALVHAPLFALGNEPAAPAKVLEHAAIHYFLVETAEQAVKGLAFSESNGHGSHPLYVQRFGSKTRQTPSPRGLAVMHPDL